MSIEMHLGEAASSAEAILKWVQVSSASVSMLAVALGIWLALREYRIKLLAERRQQKTSEVEGEIRLQAHFSALMDIANGRSGYAVSEEAAKFALSHLPEAEMKPKAINQVVEDLAILTLPVGSAAQDAAVASIAHLAVKYETLREPGLRALRSLCVPVTSKHAQYYLDWALERVGLKK